MTSHRLLGAIYLALSIAMIAWDILMAGRIANLRRIPRAFQMITGIGGLLIVPALVVAYTSESLLYGRAIILVDWLWPFTALLFVVQTVYALFRRLVTPLLGLPLLVYNVVIATVAVTKFVITRGGSPAEFGLVLNAAQASMLGTFFGTSGWGRTISTTSSAGTTRFASGSRMMLAYRRLSSARSCRAAIAERRRSVRAQASVRTSTLS